MCKVTQPLGFLRMRLHNEYFKGMKNCLNDHKRSIAYLNVGKGTKVRKNLCHVPDKKFIANFFFLKKFFFFVISLNCSCSFHFKDLFLILNEWLIFLK